MLHSQKNKSPREVFALGGFSKTSFNFYHLPTLKVVARDGIEPPTHAFSDYSVFAGLSNEYDSILVKNIPKNQEEIVHNLQEKILIILHGARESCSMLLILLTRLNMRTAKIISVSLPPDMTEEVQEIAAEERRSVSEVFREAIRQYAANRALSHVRQEAKSTVKKKKLKPEDVERIVAAGRK